MIKVLVAGEGPNELGGWAGEQSFRETSKRGVLEALMRALVPEGWTITHAETWKRLPSLRVGGGGLRKETRNALVLALRADEAKCEAVVFLRDRDRDEDRERAIREGVERARAGFPSVAIAPGVVVECLEAWLLAIRGVKRTGGFLDVESGGRARRLPEHRGDGRVGRAAWPREDRARREQPPRVVRRSAARVGTERTRLCNLIGQRSPSDTRRR